MKLDLAEIKKRFQTRTVLAVTLESGRLVVDLVRREDGAFEVLKSCGLTAGADSVVSNAEKVGKDLAAELAAAGIKERRCVVCVPASWALSTTTDVPEMADEDLRGYLELKAEREFPIAVSDLRIPHSTFAAAEGKARATLAAVAIKRIDAVERMLAAAGCRAVSLSLGLDACMPQPETPAAMHFVANGTHVDLVIAAGGGIAAMRSLAAPVNDESFDAAGFSREVRITLGRLPEGLRQQVTQARFSGSPVTAENLCLEIRQHLHRFGIESRLQRSASVTDHPGAALAAAERNLRGEKVVFEFLTPQVSRLEQTERFFQDKRRRYAALALVAAIVLPIITFIVRSHIESSLNEEWAGMRRKVADLETLQGRIRQFRPWFEPAPQSLAIMEGLAAAFPDQGDVWAKSIQVTDGTKVTCSGFARSQSALLAWFDRLRARKDVTALQVQQVRGDNPIQFSITYKSEAHDANKSRETLLKIAVGAMVGLFLFDRLILSTAVGSWKAQSERLDVLRAKVERGRQLEEREQSIRGRWTQMETTDLNDDSSTAENDVYKALNRWSQASRVNFTSLTPTWRPHEDGGYDTFECRATAVGDQTSLGRLIYEIETDPLPARVEECELTARDPQGKQLTLSLRCSFVRITEGKASR